MQTRSAISSTRLYHIWVQMIQRCNNPKSTTYHKYGLKGIKVCDEWHDPYKFMGWALLNGYRDGLTIDRENFNLNYTPENCRWVTTEIQGINRRKTKRNTSGYVGVSWHSQKQKWVARVTVKKKRFEIGLFDNAEQAHLARKQYFIDNNLLEHLATYERQHN